MAAALRQSGFGIRRKIFPLLYTVVAVIALLTVSVIGHSQALFAQKRARNGLRLGQGEA